MGTRHLIAVQCDGEYKVAQYGQWDGYPSGQGVDVLSFAQKISDSYNRNAFMDKVRKCRWLTQEEVDRRNEMIKSGEVEDWTKVWPELSRDTGAGILDLVNGSADGLCLNNSIDFAADSLFCEWAYVIDLDAGTLEVYRGFNKEMPLTEADRFFFLRDKEGEGYYGVRMVKKYLLNDLPAKSKFIEELEGGDE